MKKKAKIVLIVISLFSVAGESLAFMAARKNIEIWYTSATFPGTGKFELLTFHAKGGTGPTTIVSDITDTTGGTVVRTMELSLSE